MDIKGVESSTSSMTKKGCKSVIVCKTSFVDFKKEVSKSGEEKVKENHSGPDITSQTDKKDEPNVVDG